MAGEQTVLAEAAILALREKALASKADAEVAAAALLAASPNDPFHDAPPPEPVARLPPQHHPSVPGIDAGQGNRIKHCWVPR